MGRSKAGQELKKRLKALGVDLSVRRGTGTSYASYIYVCRKDGNPLTKKEQKAIEKITGINPGATYCDIISTSKLEKRLGLRKKKRSSQMTYFG
jgi:hypothetical protein